MVKVDNRFASRYFFFGRRKAPAGSREGQSPLSFEFNYGMYTTVLPVCEPQVQSMEVVCPGNYLNVPVSNN